MNYIFAICVLILVPIVQPKISRLHPKLMLNLFHSEMVQLVDTKIGGTQCASDMEAFFADLSEMKLWALQMFDASSKVNPGILSLNLRWYGNYDQCLDIREVVGGRVIEGQYCNAFIILTDNLTAYFSQLFNIQNQRAKAQIFENQQNYLGICIPKSCTVNDLNLLGNGVETLFKTPFHIAFQDDFCTSRTKSIASPIDAYVFCFFGIVLAVVAVSTAYDVYLRMLRKKPDLFVVFSLYTNGKKLLGTHCENDNLKCLNGIRVLTMVWVIVAHLFIIRIYASNTNNLYVMTEWQQRIENSVFFASSYAVETFFCMSGILVTYVHMKYLEKFSIKLHWFYLFRLLRLVPALAATILISISVVKYVTEGPIWHAVLKQHLTNCKETWWSTLLFVNNFIKYDDMCIHQSWYLSVDTQLYAMAPLILFSIKKNPTRTFLVIIVLCFVSIVYTWTITVVKHVEFLVFYKLKQEDLVYVYFSTLSHMPAWLIGIVFGYFLYQNKNKKNSISRLVNITLWLVSLCSMLALVLYHVVFTRHNYDVTRSAFFNSLSRPIWSLAVCSIIYSCSTGRGGCVNTFLSHPVFVVLGKLTYSMYLIHVLVIFVVVGNPKESTHFSNFEIFHDFCGIFVDILVCSFVICLVFETPVMLLIKYFFQRNTEIKRP
ncbi:hypothetical protein MTP99_011629 [Tenebrio molitor]|nr:hypothetical protein MTP99_011629 [Tenebrio molitor]